MQTTMTTLYRQENADEEYNTESGFLEADCNGADAAGPYI